MNIKPEESLDILWEGFHRMMKKEGLWKEEFDDKLRECWLIYLSGAKYGITMSLFAVEEKNEGLLLSS